MYLMVISFSVSFLQAGLTPATLALMGMGMWTAPLSEDFSWLPGFRHATDLAKEQTYLSIKIAPYIPELHVGNWWIIVEYIPVTDNPDSDVNT